MRLLIWDFDGTLAYREGGNWAATLLELLRREMPELDVDAEQLASFLQTGFPWHRPNRPHPEIRTPEAWWSALLPVFERAFRGVGVTIDQARSLARQVRPAYADPSRWRVFEDTLRTLDRLTGEGWTHVLLSNHVPELRTILDELALTGRLHRVFNSAETGYEKPHQDAFQMVLDSFPDATAAWMVGDSVKADVAGAEAVGLPAILVRAESSYAQRRCSTLRGVEAFLSGER